MAVAYTAADITPSVLAACRRRCSALVMCLLALASPVLAQDQPPSTVISDDTRTQYPALLVNSYFSINVGRLDYPFSTKQLEPGFTSATIQVPPIAVRAVLIGHQFTPYFSVQAHYLRPVQYLAYRNINGADVSGHVWMHFGGVTAKDARCRWDGAPRSMARPGSD